MVMCWEREGCYGNTKLSVEAQRTQIRSLTYRRFFNPNTTFFSLLTRVRLASRRALLLVILNIEMVKQDNGDSKPILVYQRVYSLLLSFIILRMFAVRNNTNKKLTKVVSTKLSIEDYNRFVIYTWAAYSEGIIDEPNPSRFLRFIATVFFEGLLDKTTAPSPSSSAVMSESPGT
jgi:hypothetical protein